MNALAPHDAPRVAPRVARLVAMLSTDHDGEALAAVRALARTLDGNGLDFNDLAALLAGSQDAHGARRRDVPQAEAMLKALLASDLLTPWERGYCSDLARIIYRGASLSAAQLDKLAEIYAQRIGGAA